jgi:hypothetical protein
MNFERLYEYRFRDIDQSDRRAVWKPIARHVYEELGRPHRILDPAAGLGEFISNVPSPERWALDQAAYPEAEGMEGVKMIIADVMDADLPKEHFDGVFVSNLLEHLKDQPAVYEFLTRIRESVRPGGMIAIMGPNIRYCAKEYWDCADHEVALTHVAVEEHLYMAGFEPQKTIPRFLPYSFRSRLPASAGLTAAYLRFKPAWSLLGKQFLVTARR